MAAQRRGFLLLALAGVASRQLNEGVLKTSLAGVGHRVGSDMVRADLSWLDQHGLIRIERIDTSPGELWVAHLTVAGGDVAQACSRHPGVDIPVLE